MVGLVITIAQCKGGAVKTTLATQLAVSWARCGARVAALDIDPQGTFSAWAALRRARLGEKASVLILRRCLAGARRDGSTIGSVRWIWY